MITNNNFSGKERLYTGVDLRGGIWGFLRAGGGGLGGIYTLLENLVGEINPPPLDHNFFFQFIRKKQLYWSQKLIFPHNVIQKS